MAVNRDFSSTDSRVHIFSSNVATFEATASKVTELINKGIQSHKTSHVIVASGNSISQTLGLLSKDDADWSKVNWYLADERCVAQDDRLRNDLQVARVLKKSLGENFGRVISASSSLSPKEAASEYASRISAIDMFDFCLLGMGNDGHIASLLPKHPALNSNQLCSDIYDSPNPPATRITVTLKLMQSVSNRILVTAGSGKSSAVHDYIMNPQAPVRLYNPTAIFADQAAYA